VGSPVPRTVMHVLPDLRIGGGQTIALQGLRQLDGARYRAVVVSLGADTDAMTAAYRGSCAAVVSLGHQPDQGPSTVGRLVRLIREHGVELVHTHSDLDRKLGQSSALLSRVPVVGHLHSEWIHFGSMAPPGASTSRRVRSSALAFVRDGIERRTVRHYVAESARVKELFAPMVSAPISVLQQALPLESYEEAIASGDRLLVRAELGVPEDALLLVNVSRLVDGKGQDDLFPLLATVRLRRPDTWLLLVGEGDRREVLERAACENGVLDRVVFAGDRSDVARILVAADIFVFPSYTEGFGMVALEAMGAGLPVVAYDLPPFHEFMQPGTTSLLCPTGDVSALTSAVESLVADPGRAARLGTAARLLAKERFPSDGVARVFQQVYDSVLGPPAT